MDTATAGRRPVSVVTGGTVRRARRITHMTMAQARPKPADRHIAGWPISAP
jgi:hypothetical protein